MEPKLLTQYSDPAPDLDQVFNEQKLKNLQLKKLDILKHGLKV